MPALWFSFLHQLEMGWEVLLQSPLCTGLFWGAVHGPVPGPRGFLRSTGSSTHVGRARHRGEATSSPPHLSPIRHGALRREVGSPELWWWTRARGSGPTLAWGPMLWGEVMKKAWGLGTVVANVSIGQPATLGLCWPKPVTSELVSKIATCRWGPHTLSLPPHPCTCSRLSWEHSRPQSSCLLCALCLVLCPQMAVGSPHSSGLSSNMGSVRPTLAAQFRITPHLLFQSLIP